MKRVVNAVVLSLFTLFGSGIGGCLMNLQDLFDPPSEQDCSMLTVGDETFEFCL